MQHTRTHTAIAPASIIATLVAFCGTLRAGAQPLALERADHASAPRSGAVIHTPPGQDLVGTSVSSSVRITQVNVNAAQQNLAGDAANEPSLAHDPRFPSRIAVGWRQFDAIASNFRQAGVAWSNDAGRTWHASTLQAGTFRSDPVLRARPRQEPP